MEHGRYPKSIHSAQGNESSAHHKRNNLSCSTDCYTRAYECIRVVVLKFRAEAVYYYG